MWKKSKKFLDSPRMDVLDFSELRKNWRFEAPPSDLIWEKVEIGKILNFGNPPPRKTNMSLKHLKLPKNNFKTNLSPFWTFSTFWDIF